MPISRAQLTETSVLQAALDEHDSIHGLHGHDFMPAHWTHFARKLVGSPPYRIFPDGTTEGTHKEKV
jgi:hypothetical protein